MMVYNKRDVRLIVLHNEYSRWRFYAQNGLDIAYDIPVIIVITLKGCRLFDVIEVLHVGNYIVL